MLAQRVSEGAASREGCLLALQAMSHHSLKETPEPWIAGLNALLATGDADLKREAVTTAKSLTLAKQRPPKLISELLKIGQNAGIAVQGPVDGAGGHARRSD